MKNFFVPAEVIETNMKAGETKAKLSFFEMILLGIMAGAFIAIGAATSSTAAHNIANVGLARTISGVIFPVGLMMIVFVGGELFTGNCLIFTAVLHRRIKWYSCLRNLLVVYFSNLVGSLFIVVMTYYSGNLDYSNGLLGAYAIKIAIGKVGIDFGAGIASGILCNILVCIAVLVAVAANDIAGKVWGIFFPVFAFVVGGFEHCVANMFYIPMGIMAAQNATYVAKAQEVYGFSMEQIESLTIQNSLGNFLPVTIGNMIGGMLCVALPYYLIYRKKWSEKN